MVAIGLGLTTLMSLAMWRASASCARATSNATEAKDQMRAQFARFLALTGSAPIGILRVDADGEIMDANGRLAEIAGVTAEEILGQGLWQRVHAADREALRSLLTASDEDGALRCGSSETTSSAGSTCGSRWSSPKSTRRRTGLATVIDVTEQMFAEETLVQSEATQQLITREFARQARHDPLTMLTNRAELTEQWSTRGREG